MIKDLFGQAILDYYHGNYTQDLITSTNISEEDVLPLPYLFRRYSEMPMLEQKALQLCKGSVLDVGCGAGNHGLWLQERGLKVKGIDISEGAINVSLQRGLKNTKVQSLIEETGSFDTILLLMNGTGIFQEMKRVSRCLKHLKSLMKNSGQILIDSTDIRYMYDEDDFPKDNYYGELDYYLSYKDKEEFLKWLYLDFETLKTVCRSVGLDCEKIMDGDHYDYLARITQPLN